MLSVDVNIEDNASSRQGVRNRPTGIGLTRLMFLRLFMISASFLSLALFSGVSPTNIPFPLIVFLLLGMIISVVFILAFRLDMNWPITYNELLFHLLIDAGFLVIVVAYEGGFSNPLISYLLVLLAVSATLLPKMHVYSFSVFCIIFYTTFLLLDLTLGNVMSESMTSRQMNFQVHLQGMWMIFVVSAVLITVFVTRMAETIKKRENNLAEARETEIRNEQLIAIGTLAAGTAHALGTPLSTMSVLLSELDKQEIAQLGSARNKKDVSILRDQVASCKNSINQLTNHYHKENTSQHKNVLVSSFIANIRNYLSNIHPFADLTFELTFDNYLEINSDPSLEHGLINIIENAVKASKQKVLVKIASETKPLLTLHIQDDGPGIPLEILESMGEPFLTMRSGGMGLGLFLANASIQRLGGTIEMENMRDGGAMTTISLPLVEQSL
jgi:two-component system sensor histidine kinase RegB